MPSLRNADAAQIRADFQKWMKAAAEGEEKVDLSDLTPDQVAELFGSVIGDLIQGLISTVGEIGGGKGLQEQKVVTGTMLTFNQELGPNKSLLAVQIQIAGGQTILDNPESMETFQEHMLSSVGTGGKVASA